MSDVVDEDLSDFVADEDPLVDVVLEEGQELLLVGHAQHHREAGAVGNAEDLVLGDGEDDVGEGVVAEAGDPAVVDLLADDVVVAGFLHLDQVDHSVVQPHQDLLGDVVVVEAERLLRVALRPELDELGGLHVALPGFNTADLHELAALAFPGQLGVGDLGVEAVDWALVGSGDDEEVLVLHVDVVADALGLALDLVLEVQLGRVDHHFRRVLVQLQELLDQLRVHEIIAHDDLPEELLESGPALLHLLLGHLEEVALLGQWGQRVVGVLEPVEELVELGEALLDVPLVVARLELDVEEDCASLGLALREGRNGHLHSRRQIVVVHRRYI